jgi:hypothetical protein
VNDAGLREKGGLRAGWECCWIEGEGWIDGQVGNVVGLREKGGLMGKLGMLLD